MTTQTSKPTSVSPKKKPQACKICSAPAFTNNFGCLSCESCKIFFRRAALKEKIYTCIDNETCTTPGVSIRKCIACRLERCYLMGMKKELIYLKSLNRKMNRLKPHDNAAIPANFPRYKLTAYEDNCLAKVREAGRAFPDERELATRITPTRLIDPRQSVQNVTNYTNFMVSFANNFEEFCAIDVVNQAKLVKPFFDYFFTVRFSFNFVGDFKNICIFGSRGTLLTFDWDEFMANLIKDNRINNRFKAMAVQGSKALGGDPMVRDLILTLVLFLPNDQIVFNEYLHYCSSFYSLLLKRYLITKHQSIHVGLAKFKKAIELIDICKTARSFAWAFFENIDLRQLNDLMSEIYELV